MMIDVWWCSCMYMISIIGNVYVYIYIYMCVFSYNVHHWWSFAGVSKTTICCSQLSRRDFVLWIRPWTNGWELEAELISDIYDLASFKTHMRKFILVGPSDVIINDDHFQISFDDFRLHKTSIARKISQPSAGMSFSSVVVSSAV